MTCKETIAPAEGSKYPVKLVVMHVSWPQYYYNNNIPSESPNTTIIQKKKNTVLVNFIYILYVEHRV